MSFFTSLGNVHKWNHVVCILVLLFNFMFVRFICVTACWDTSLVFIDVHCGNIGEGDGNPLQYSCLENPMDGGAWWAAVHSVAESDTTEVTWHACNQCSEWLVSKVLSHLEATYFIVPKNSINLS